MAKVIIKGDFTLEGDIPALELMCKRFKYVVLDFPEYPSIRITAMLGVSK